jgi:hypothetical protein
LVLIRSYFEPNEQTALWALLCVAGDAACYFAIAEIRKIASSVPLGFPLSKMGCNPDEKSGRQSSLPLFSSTPSLLSGFAADIRPDTWTEERGRDVAAE